MVDDETQSFTQTHGETNVMEKRKTGQILSPIETADVVTWMRNHAKECALMTAEKAAVAVTADTGIPLSGAGLNRLAKYFDTPVFKPIRGRDMDGRYVQKYAGTGLGVDAYTDRATLAKCVRRLADVIDSLCAELDPNSEPSLPKEAREALGVLIARRHVERGEERND